MFNKLDIITWEKNPNISVPEYGLDGVGKCIYINDLLDLVVNESEFVYKVYIWEELL